MKIINILLAVFLLALGGVIDNFATAAVVALRDSDTAANINAVPPNGRFAGGMRCHTSFVDPFVCGNAETSGASSYISDELCNEICQCNDDSLFFFNCQSYGSCSSSKVYQMCTKNGCQCTEPGPGAKEVTHIPGKLMMILRSVQREKS